MDIYASPGITSDNSVSPDFPLQARSAEKEGGGDQLPAEYLASPLSKQSQEPLAKVGQEFSQSLFVIQVLLSSYFSTFLPFRMVYQKGWPYRFFNTNLLPLRMASVEAFLPFGR